MSDVLKQVEEALVEAQLQIDYLHRKFQPTATGEAVNAKCAAALTALRGLEWKPIAEMADHEQFDVMIGKWIGNTWSSCAVTYKSAATNNGYTHFCRPILPTPPKREGQ